MDTKYSKENDGYRYMLFVIDTFSKYLWIQCLKTKSGLEVTNAFNKIFKESKRIPKMLMTDLGTEFISKETQDLFKKLGIKWYATNSDKKVMIVERVGLTIQQKMYRYFSHKNTNKWIDIIQDICENYNNSHHSVIKCTPVEASSEARESTVYHNLYGTNNRLSRQQNYIRNEKPVYKIGDKVRITRYRTKMDRGYHAKFLDEIYEIIEVVDSQPITYRVKDYNGDPVVGSFYKQELSIYNKPDEEWMYEYIIDYDDEEELAFVKWKNYPNKFNSWITLTRKDFEEAKEDDLYKPEKQKQRKQRKDKIVRTKRIATLGK